MANFLLFLLLLADPLAALLNETQVLISLPGVTKLTEQNFIYRGNPAALAPSFAQQAQDAGETAFAAVNSISSAVAAVAEKAISAGIDAGILRGVFYSAAGSSIPCIATTLSSNCSSSNARRSATVIMRDIVSLFKESCALLVLKLHRSVSRVNPTPLTNWLSSTIFGRSVGKPAFIIEQEQELARKFESYADELDLQWTIYQMLSAVKEWQHEIGSKSPTNQQIYSLLKQAWAKYRAFNMSGLDGADNAELNNLDLFVLSSNEVPAFFRSAEFFLDSNSSQVLVEKIIEGASSGTYISPQFTAEALWYSMAELIPAERNNATQAKFDNKKDEFSNDSNERTLITPFSMHFFSILKNL